MKKKPKKESIKITIDHMASVKAAIPPAGQAGMPTKWPPRMRLEALAAYMADMNGCSVEDVHKDPRFNMVPMQTFKSWSTADKWTEHRKKAYEALKNRLSIEVSKVLSDQVYQEVQELRKWNEKSTSLLEDPALKARSWEGVLKSKMEIQKRLFEISQMVNQGLVDEMGRSVEEKTMGALTSGPSVAFSQDQLAELAKIYTQQERERLREKLRISNPEMYEDEIKTNEETDSSTTPAGSEETPETEPTGAWTGDDVIPELYSSVDPNSGSNKGNGA